MGPLPTLTLVGLILILVDSGIAQVHCPVYTNETVCRVTLGQLGVFDEDYPMNVSDAEWRRRERLWPCRARDFVVSGWFAIYVDLERLLFKFLLPLVIVIGVALNVLALISTKKKLRKKGSNPACLSKAVCIFSQYQCFADIGALLSTCLIGYLRSTVHRVDHLFLEHLWICRTDKMTTTFFQCLSPWMNVIIAFSRRYDLKKPLGRHVDPMSSMQIHGCMIKPIVVVAFLAAAKLQFSGFDQYSAFEYQRCERSGHTTIFVTAIEVALTTAVPTALLTYINYDVTREMRRRSDWNPNIREQTQRAIQTIKTVTIFYIFVQIPLGCVEFAELYWGIVKAKTLCFARPEEIAVWRIEKVTLRWIRASFYIFNQFGYIINFSCLLLTSADFDVFCQFGGRIRELFSRPPEPASKKESEEDIISETVSLGLESTDFHPLVGKCSNENLCILLKYVALLKKWNGLPPTPPQVV